MKNALVTGGAGFIGTHLVNRLLIEGWDVTILDDLSVGKIENVSKKARLVTSDIRDTNQVTKAATGCDAIFHLAAKVTIRGSVENYKEDADINVMGTLSILKAAMKVRCPRLVFASSMAVYADSDTSAPLAESYSTEPLSPYGISKLLAEKYLLLLGPQAGIKTVILRLFNTFGTGQTFTPYVGVITIFIKHLLAGEQLTIFGNGEQKRDFVYVGDVANAFIRAAESDVSGKVFNIGTGKATSVNQIAKLLQEKLGKSVKVRFEPIRSEELRNSVADISEAVKCLAYTPVGSLKNQLYEVIESVQSTT